MKRLHFRYAGIFAGTWQVIEKEDVDVNEIINDLLNLNALKKLETTHKQTPPAINLKISQLLKIIRANAPQTMQL